MTFSSIHKGEDIDGFLVRAEEVFVLHFNNVLYFEIPNDLLLSQLFIFILSWFGIAQSLSITDYLSRELLCFSHILLELLSISRNVAAFEFV